ncbi:MAG: GGDEF domain-containing protein [Kosmotoga sp.]|nr:MAG: GGDEF domain-containing protein [Kosmotoga sp.]
MKKRPFTKMLLTRYVLVSAAVITFAIVISTFFFNYYYQENIYEPAYKSAVSSVHTYLDQWGNTMLAYDSTYHAIVREILLLIAKEIKENPDLNDEKISVMLDNFVSKNMLEDVDKVNWYIISKEGVVTRTNYHDDLGLDIAKMVPIYWKRIDLIKKNDYLVESLAIELKTNRPRIFGYYRLPDESFLEIGLAINPDVISNMLEKLSTLTESLAYVNSLQMYSIAFSPFSEKYENLKDREKELLSEARDKGTFIIDQINENTSIIYDNWIPTGWGEANVNFLTRLKLTMDFSQLTTFKNNTYMLLYGLIIFLSLLIILTSYFTTSKFFRPFKKLLNMMRSFRDNPRKQPRRAIISNISEVKEMENVFLNLSKRVTEHISNQEQDKKKLSELLKEKELLANKLRDIASTDELTKTRNRRALLEILNLLIEQAEKSSNIFTICYFDVDGLKRINDTLGHKTGDSLLKFVAEKFKNNLRESDILGRMGGDEFLILFPDSNLEQAQRIVTRIKENLNNDKLEELENITVKISCGFATFKPEENITADDLLVEADKAMYKNKNKDAE